MLLYSKYGIKWEVLEECACARSTLSSNGVRRRRAHSPDLTCAIALQARCGGGRLWRRCSSGARVQRRRWRRRRRGANRSRCVGGLGRSFAGTGDDYAAEHRTGSNTVQDFGYWLLDLTLVVNLRPMATLYFRCTHSVRCLHSYPPPFRPASLQAERLEVLADRQRRKMAAQVRACGSAREGRCYYPSFPLWRLCQMT